MEQLDSDVALFKLAEDLPLNDSLKHAVPICLPEARESLDAKAGKSFTTSGWGASKINLNGGKITIRTKKANKITDLQF